MLYKIARWWISIVGCGIAVLVIWVIACMVRSQPWLALGAALFFLTISAAMIVAEGPND